MNALIRSLITFFIGLISLQAFADPMLTPCTNSPTVLTYLNRPNNADSACTVPFKNLLFEMGYLYSDLSGGGNGQEFPQLSIRFGLPKDTELVILTPNYNLQTTDPSSGFDTTWVGLKHQALYSQNWVFSLEGYVIPTSGSNAFGSDDVGGVINGIFAYTFNSAISMTFMLGLNTQTTPPDSGGERYNFLSPNLVLTWQVDERLQTYAEIFGQTQTAPGEGAGFNMDLGVLYLLKKNIEIDAEIGRRLTGNLGGYNTYIGAGLSILL